MLLPTTLSFLSFLLFTQTAETVKVWKTVLLVTKNSSKNIKTLLGQYGIHPPGAEPGLSSSRVFDIASGRDEFRSPLIDNWPGENHTEVRLAVFNKHGDILWHLTLDGFGSDLTNWNRPSRSESSSDPKLMTDVQNLDISFDDTGLNITRTTDNKGWLWIDYSATPRIWFSSRGAKSNPTTFTPIDNPAEVSILGSPTSVVTFKESRASKWGVALGAAQYIIGFAIGTQGTNLVTQFRLAYSAEEGCLGQSSDTYTTYKEDNGTDRVFSATYDSNGFAKFDMVTFYAQCLVVTEVSGIGNTGLSLNMWRYQGDHLDGAMFGIQWGVDVDEEDPLLSAISEIQQQLTFNRYDTALYRSQFTSATDNRGSAVVFGVAGIIIFLIVILGIVLLDLSTLSQHTRFSKRNFGDFKETLRKARRKLRERKAKKNPRLVDVKQITVKVAQSGGAGATGGVAVKGAKSSSTPSTPKAPEKSKAGSEKTDKKSNFKKSVKTVMNVKTATNKKTPALLSKISE